MPGQFIKQGQADLAETIFADMDKSFSNYFHRLEYCKFLLKIEKMELAKEKLSDLIEEFDHVKGPERKLNQRHVSTDQRFICESRPC